MKKTIIALFFCVITFSCTDGDNATRILKEQGYTNIVITGHGFWSCSKDDIFSTEFSAVSPTGITVKGVFCSGFTKGGTIRFF